MAKDLRYQSVQREFLPKGEALKDVVKRFLPLWEKEIIPKIKSGRRILIVAHGNSLRALIQHLGNLSPEQIMAEEVPTGIPLLYELDNNLKIISKGYLGDPAEAAARIAAVAAQGKATKK